MTKSEYFYVLNTMQRASKVEWTNIWVHLLDFSPSLLLLLADYYKAENEYTEQAST
jgi:hypothetical protein